MSVPSWHDALNAWADEGLGRLQWQRSLAEVTTLKVGGAAEAFIEPASSVGLASAWQIAQSAKIPFWVLGGGTNLVVADGGLPGMVVHLRRGFGFAGPRVPDDPYWHVGAGCGTGRLVRLSLEHGRQGAEVLAGVPGTVGGALMMNAGGHEGEIGPAVRWVEGMLKGKVERFSQEACGFVYRGSGFPKGMVLTSALFEFPPASDVAAIKAQVKASQARRRQTQPLNMPNAGSIFKNPPKHSAGRLIESAGCKGWDVGGAEVSAVHANFIVNRGGALAQDVVTLAHRVQKHVAKTHGVVLEFEVKLLGQFGASS